MMLKSLFISLDYLFIINIKINLVKERNMVRFKNRYIIAELSKQSTIETMLMIEEADLINSTEQRALLSHIKSQAE